MDKPKRKVIQFSVDNFGRFFLLFDDGSMVECEQVRSADFTQLNILSEIYLNEKEN